ELYIVEHPSRRGLFRRQIHSVRVVERVDDECGCLSPELRGVEDASPYCARSEIPAADDEEWPVGDPGDVKERVGDDKDATVGVCAEHDTDGNRVLRYVLHPREQVVPPQIRHSLDADSTLEGGQIGLSDIQEP